MGRKEEITDLISDKGIREIQVGKVLKFDYEGSPIWIKVTRKDTKAMRIWGEHVELVDAETGFSHYRHNVDTTDETIQQYGVPFCTDCMVPINKHATVVGDKRALLRYEIQDTKRKIRNLRRRKGGKK